MLLLRFNSNRFITNLTNKIITHLYYLFSLNSKRVKNTFNDFVNVIKKDPKVQIKIKDMLDRYSRLPYNCQSKIGYDTLTQNVILKELKYTGYNNYRFRYRNTKEK